ncbi:MAG: hypothetical protein IIW90_01340 [Alistipes sp.]|nr:hypothetical protein [Alistipes sp.]
MKEERGKRKVERGKMREEKLPRVSNNLGRSIGGGRAEAKSCLDYAEPRGRNADSLGVILNFVFLGLAPKKTTPDQHCWSGVVLPKEKITSSYS